MNIKATVCGGFSLSNADNLDILAAKHPLYEPEEITVYSNHLKMQDSEAA
nr:hypothetical protein [Thaumasiovibrio subtropicus]